MIYSFPIYVIHHHIHQCKHVRYVRIIFDSNNLSNDYEQCRVPFRNVHFLWEWKFKTIFNIMNTNMILPSCNIEQQNQSRILYLHK